MPKHLTICCDEAWKTADQAIGRVASPDQQHQAGCLRGPADSAEVRQCVYPHSGVGTSRWERLRGGTFDAGLESQRLRRLPIPHRQQRTPRRTVPLRAQPPCFHRPEGTVRLISEGSRIVGSGWNSGQLYERPCGLGRLQWIR